MISHVFKLLALSNGETTMVDPEDYEKLSQYNWHEGGGGYVVGRPKGTKGRHKNVRMHRLLLDATDAHEVDHANNNRMDNRKLNLRLCTKSQNLANRMLPRRRGSYRGVRKRPDCERWDAQIKCGKTHHLGMFKTPEEAARAYDEAARRFYGEFATLNNI